MGAIYGSWRTANERSGRPFPRAQRVISPRCEEVDEHGMQCICTLGHQDMAHIFAAKPVA